MTTLINSFSLESKYFNVDHVISEIQDSVIVPWQNGMIMFC